MMKIFRRLFRNRVVSCALFMGIILALAFPSGAKASTEQEVEHYKIVYLLNVIGASELGFMRNGTEYTGEEAKTHLRDKLNYAGDRIRTAEDFINYIASESSETGLSYYVRFADGTQMEAGIWLRNELAKMK